MRRLGVRVPLGVLFFIYLFQLIEIFPIFVKTKKNKEMNNLSSPENMQGWYQKPLSEITKTEQKSRKTKGKPITKINVIPPIKLFKEHIEDCDNLLKNIENSYNDKAIKELYDAIIHIESAKKCLMIVNEIPFSEN